MLVRGVIAFLIFYFLFSCSNNDYRIKYIKDTKTIFNSSNGVNSKFNIVLDSISNISHQDLTKPGDLVLDSLKSIYVLDFRNHSIFKFDSLGKFLFKFSNKGNGPGELNSPTSLFLKEDTLCVVDVNERQYVKFNSLNGEYIENKKKSNMHTIEPIRSFSSGKFISKSIIQTFENKEEYIHNKVFLLNSKLKIIDTVYTGKRFLREKESKLANRIIFSFNKYDKMKRIYCYKNSFDNYEIHTFQSDGKLEFIIRKPYIKIPFKYKKSLLYKGFKNNYKLSIQDMLVDKYGYLWVINTLQDNENSFNNSLIVDVFKDGIFINKVDLKLEDAVDILNIFKKNYIFNDRFINLDVNKGEIKIFKYRNSF